MTDKNNKAKTKKRISIGAFLILALGIIADATGIISFFDSRTEKIEISAFEKGADVRTNTKTVEINIKYSHDIKSAQYFMSVGKYDEAKEILKSCIIMFEMPFSPHSDEAFSVVQGLLGQCYYKTDDFLKAEEHLIESCNHYEFKVFHELLAEVYYELHKREINGDKKREYLKLMRDFYKKSSLLSDTRMYKNHLENINISNYLSPIEGGKTYAIIMGINNYLDGSIPNLMYAENDANLIAEKIKAGASNNEVIIIDNPTRSNIYNTLKTIGEKITPNDKLIIYYSGHGFEYSYSNILKIDTGRLRQGEQYIMPSDFDPQDPILSGISVENINDYIQTYNLRYPTLVMIDACSNTTVVDDNYSESGTVDIYTIGVLSTDDTSITNDDNNLDKQGNFFYPQNHTFYLDQMRMKPQQSLDPNLVVISSSSPDQKSIETSDLEHGVFSYFVGEALDAMSRTNYEDKTISGALNPLYKATDKSDITVTQDDPALGAVFDNSSVFKDPITVTVVATDSEGDNATETTTGTLNGDDEGPLITCPVDITTLPIVGDCDGEEVTISVPVVCVETIVSSAIGELQSPTYLTNYLSNGTYTNDCDCVTLLSGRDTSIPLGVSFPPVGTTTVNYTATDGAGNTAICTFTVTVSPPESPIVFNDSNIILSNAPLIADSQTITKTTGDNGVYDCDIVIPYSKDELINQEVIPYTATKTEEYVNDGITNDNFSKNKIDGDDDSSIDVMELYKFLDENVQQYLNDNNYRIKPLM